MKVFDASPESIMLCSVFAIFVVFLMKMLLRSKRVRIDPQGKYVLITGCDSGFGRETAVRLDHLGFHVFATCLGKEGQEYLKMTCSNRIRTVIVDVTKEDEIKRAFDEVKRTIPGNTGLWGIVNNAGVLRWGPVEWEPLDNFKSIANVNLWGTINMTRTFLGLIKAAQGRVVNFSSSIGILPLPNMAPYCVSKAGVEAFSDSLRREMEPWGVRISIMEPGAFQTSIIDPERIMKQMQGLWESLGRDMQQAYGKRFFESKRDKFRGSKDIHVVADAVEDALTAAHPKTRYRIGPDATLFAFLSFLPTSIGDKLVKGLLREELPQACHFKN